MKKIISISLAALMFIAVATFTSTIRNSEAEAQQRVRHTFDMACTLSHSLNDDPIVFPRQPGVSHLHDFFGSPWANANVGSFWLHAFHRRYDLTTCNRPENGSSYWMPAAFNSQGEKVDPDKIVLYYRNDPQDTEVVGFPPAFKILNSDVVFVGPAPNAGSGGDGFKIQIGFPDCLDGRADSPDHKSHGVVSTNGFCPPSHPIKVPRITMAAIYPERIVNIASGDLSTAHGDFMNGWEPNALQDLIDRCLIEGRDIPANVEFCKAGPLVPPPVTTSTMPPGTTTTTLPPTTTTTQPSLGSGTYPITVSCDSGPIDADIRVDGQGGRGTVVLFTGGQGTKFYGDGITASFVETLRNDGWKTAEVKWGQPGWLVGNNGVKDLACRPASAISWVKANVHSGGELAITGNSGGATAVSTAIVYQGIEVDIVIPTGGPPHADLKMACLAGTSPEYPPQWGGGGQAAITIDGSWGYISGTGPCFTQNSSFVGEWDANSTSQSGDHSHEAEVHILSGATSGKDIFFGEQLLNALLAGGTNATQDVLPGVGHTVHKTVAGQNAIRSYLNN